MSKKYDKAVFDFFTEDEEKFKQMGQILEFGPNIRTALIEGFWTKLKDALKSKLEKEGWKVRFSDDFSVGWNKVIIYREAWKFKHSFPLVSVGFENLFFGQDPFLGILVDDFHRTKGWFDTIQLKNDLHNHEEIKRFGVDKNKWWPIKHSLTISLKDYDSLCSILPIKKTKKEEGIKEITSNQQKAIQSLLSQTLVLVEALDKFANESNNFKNYKRS